MEDIPEEPEPKQQKQTINEINEIVVEDKSIKNEVETPSIKNVVSIK